VPPYLAPCPLVYISQRHVYLWCRLVSPCVAKYVGKMSAISRSWLRYGRQNAWAQKIAMAVEGNGGAVGVDKRGRRTTTDIRSLSFGGHAQYDNGPKPSYGSLSH